MALEGLRAAPQLQGHVEATVEALRWLGLVEDREALQNSLSTEFAALSDSGVPGEPYIQIPQSVYPVRDLVRVLRYGYPPTLPFGEDEQYAATEHDTTDPLWREGARPSSYQAHEIGNLAPPSSQGEAWVPHARLAVYDTTSSKHHDLRHFRDQPFDAQGAAIGRTYGQRAAAASERPTQLEEIAAAADRYPGYSVVPLNANALAMICLIRRVQGLPMPLGIDGRSAPEQLIDATVPRRTFQHEKTSGNGFDTISIVGAVGMGRNSMKLGTVHGNPISSVGVGLSIAPIVQGVATHGGNCR